MRTFFENDYWTSKMEQEIYITLISPYVQLMAWHVVRLDGTRLVKKLLERKPRARSKKGEDLD
jgi:hypothetical protein